MPESSKKLKVNMCARFGLAESEKISLETNMIKRVRYEMQQKSRILIAIPTS